MAEILEMLKSERSKLNDAIRILDDKSEPGPRTRKPMSVETKTKMGRAQRRRWKALKRA